MTPNAGGIAVTLSPSSILANGTSQTMVTTTGFPVGDLTVVFTSSDSGETVTNTSNPLTGTYTATITSSTTVSTPAAPVTIMANDGTLSGQASLVQYGPATGASVQLVPTSIPADGTSTTTATATVTDVNGNPVPGQTVVLSSTDANETITQPSTPTGATGTVSGTIRSSTTAGPVTITATDATTLAHGQATLIQFGPATGVSVALLPASIVANGTSTTTAVATVTDANGNRVPGQTVTFTAGTQSVSGIDQGNGIYTGVITSTTTAAPVTVTATDVGTGAAGSASLTQTPGPAVNVAVGVNPTSIFANGTSTTTAIAIVTDVNGNRVPGETIRFTAGTQSASGVDQGNGIYAATITSTTAPGQVIVTATDATTLAHGQATLTQTAGSSATVLNAVPTQPVTNQAVTIIATVTVALGTPSGTVAFMDGGAPISGCGSVPVAPAIVGSSAATATCQTSFAAANSPAALTAVFTPSAGNLGGSTSLVDSLTIGKDSTSTNLMASSANPTTGTAVTYTAAVSSIPSGPSQPSGSVRFSDGTTTLSGCGSQPLHGGSASCTVKFSSRGNHAITAHYGGDANFGSASASITTSVHRPPPPQPLLSQLGWTFGFTPAYTNVQILAGHRVPAGASIQIKCHGHGCPYAKRTILVSNAKHCKTTKTRRCTKHQSTLVDLFAAFLHHRLHPGTTLRVEILRPGWIGKYYLFTMRAGQAPRQRLACLPPGRARPVIC